MKIKLMTFNIQHGFDYIKKDRIDLALMSNVIKKCEGDIIALNEVRDEGCNADYTAQAKLIGEQLGYHWYFAQAITTKGGPYGNALISKYPIIKTDIYPIPDPIVKDENVGYESRCILKAVIDVPIISGGITIIVSHFGLAKAEERNAVAKLVEILRDVKGPCAFMGDLNMSPDNDILKPIFDILKDTAISFDKPKLSFPSDKPIMKIDYIFVDKNTEVYSADIPEIIASDHRPHIATIEI